MNETSQSKTFSAWIKGDFRTDGVESDWLKDFKRRSAEDLAGRKFIYAPHPKPQKRTPQPPRYCAVCPARLNHGNKYGFCQIHLTKNSRRAIEQAA